MRYGLPYQGSKSRIAKWVVDTLPKSHTLVDLFAGGCAVTHAALLSRKFESIIANDITDSVKVFFAAINGEFDGYSMCPSREEWLKCRDEDTAMALLMSFGNDKTTYLWSEELEAVKRPASMMVSAPSIWERYQWYRRFIDALKAYLEGNTIEQRRLKELVQLERVSRLQGLQELQGLQRLQRLQGLQELQGLQRLQRLQGLQGDYRLVEIPEGATVYADPPYRNTPNSSRYGAFDFDSFDAWLNGVNHPVFVSEFDAPPGCVEYARVSRTTSMAANGTDKRIEKIFVQERFKDDIQLPTLFGADDFE